MTIKMSSIIINNYFNALWAFNNCTVVKAEYMLQKFEHLVCGQMRLHNGNDYGFVSELTDLQIDILSILDVPKHCYSYEYLFDSS